MFRSGSKPARSFVIIFANAITIKVKGSKIALANGISISGGELIHHIGFGLFEVDLSTFELYKRGVSIQFRTSLSALTLLLERPGEVVTRDELRRKIWPADTSLDCTMTEQRLQNSSSEAASKAPTRLVLEI